MDKGFETFRETGSKNSRQASPYREEINLREGVRRN